MNRRFHDVCQTPLATPEDMKTLFATVNAQRATDFDVPWLKEVVLRILGNMYRQTTGNVLDMPPPPPPQP